MGQMVMVRCDNEATVSVVNTGKCKDPYMLAWLRDLGYIIACCQCYTSPALTTDYLICCLDGTSVLIIKISSMNKSPQSGRKSMSLRTSLHIVIHGKIIVCSDLQVC